MPPNNITNRELFQKLLDVVEKSHIAQSSTVQVLQALKSELEECRKLLQSKLWTLLIVLIAALCAAVGIKLAFPAA